MKIILYDYEVFRYNTLLGTLILDNDKETLYQTWDENEIKKFYEEHKNDIWIGHNNFEYDDHILKANVNNESAYAKSKEIITHNNRYKTKYFHLYSYDLMKACKTPFKLKLAELLCGKNIHTTDVDFELDRPLNDDEKKLTEGYNADDLYQTYDDFKKMYSLFELRTYIIANYNLNLSEALRMTGTQLAAAVLGAKRDESIIYKKVDPPIYDTLQLNNQEVWDFYLTEKFREGKSIKINVCGGDITIAAGGAHSAIKKYYAPKVLYCDVSGYYNLVMINYNLLPRTMNEASKALYTQMYHDQLALKGVKGKENQRAAFKTILLSVFGAMNNEYTDFYDPWHALLVTLTGQLFIVDLLEKLEGLVRLVQTNTDGIMLEPYDWADEPKIIGIIEEWEARTGFVIKKEHLYDLWQRDVNCYICKDKNNELICRGSLFKNYDTSDTTFASGDLFNCVEPPIVAKAIGDYLIYGKLPEDTVEENKENLLMFQYPVKKNTFTYLTLDTIYHYKNEKGKYVEEVINSEKVKDLNRVFPAKIEVNEDGSFMTSMVYKHKVSNHKESREKCAISPMSVFIYNESIIDKYDELKDKINYQHYIDTIYEKIDTIIPGE